MGSRIESSRIKTEREPHANTKLHQHRPAKALKPVCCEGRTRGGRPPPRPAVPRPGAESPSRVHPPTGRVCEGLLLGSMVRGPASDRLLLPLPAPSPPCPSNSPTHWLHHRRNCAACAGGARGAGPGAGHRPPPPPPPYPPCRPPDSQGMVPRCARPSVCGPSASLGPPAPPPPAPHEPAHCKRCCAGGARGAGQGAGRVPPAGHDRRLQGRSGAGPHRMLVAHAWWTWAGLEKSGQGRAR
jgi:hypothetical protein